MLCWRVYYSLSYRDLYVFPDLFISVIRESNLTFCWDTYASRFKFLLLISLIFCFRDFYFSSASVVFCLALDTVLWSSNIFWSLVSISIFKLAILTIVTYLSLSNFFYISLFSTALLSRSIFIPFISSWHASETWIWPSISLSRIFLSARVAFSKLSVFPLKAFNYCNIFVFFSITLFFIERSPLANFNSCYTSTKDYFNCIF